MRWAIKLLLAALSSAAVSVNLVAFMQARAMTHFSDGGARTAGPEQLSAFDKITVLLSGVNIPRPRNGQTPAEWAPAFETHRFQNPDGAKLEAWYVAGVGDDPMVALFHGYAASKSALLSAARVFHDLGYSVLLVDFYGSGGSTGSGTTIGVKEADDVASTLAYARRTWKAPKVILYGISMGGAALLRAIAVNGAQPDAIIVEASFDRLRHTSQNRFRIMGVPIALLADLLLFWGSVQYGFNFFSHNPVDYARAVKCPALILHGENDQRATLEQARAVGAAMGWLGRLVPFAGVRHMPIVEAQPDEWRNAVQQFLESLR
jgi:dipeptidyl aminopeptidase/acylaminoacyl peptidase